MHELAIMQNVVGVCEREAEKQGFARVEKIVLSIGELSGIVPECLREFFPIAAKGSVAEGAQIATRVISPEIECPDCGYAGGIRGFECPACGSTGFRLTHGREFYIDSLEVE